MGICGSNCVSNRHRKCHDPNCDLPGIIEYKGCWRCDTHNAEWQLYLDNQQKVLRHDDDSYDTEEEEEYNPDTRELQQHGRRLFDNHPGLDLDECADFSTLFQIIQGTIFYTDRERAHAPGMDRDVRRLLDGGHTNSTPGYLYVFRLEGDAPDYLKIGYTKDIDARVKQWRKKFKEYGALQVVAFYHVSYARFAERAVHLLLAPFRLGRYLLGDGRIYTEYFYCKHRGSPDTNDLLSESPFDPPDDQIPGHVRSKKREVEWFCFDQQQVGEICDMVVYGVNKLL